MSASIGYGYQSHQCDQILPYLKIEKTYIFLQDRKLGTKSFKYKATARWRMLLLFQATVRCPSIPRGMGRGAEPKPPRENFLTPGSPLRRRDARVYIFFLLFSLSLSLSRFIYIFSSLGRPTIPPIAPSLSRAPRTERETVLCVRVRQCSERVSHTEERQEKKRETFEEIETVLEGEIRQITHTQPTRRKETPACGHPSRH